MKQTLSQSRNAEVSLSEYPSSPFEYYGLRNTEGKMSLLINELNRLRMEMVEESELWNLEGLSESLKMLADWTDDSIVSLKAKKSDSKHYRDDFEKEDDLPDYWGRLDPNVTLPFDFEEEQYECEA